MRPDGSAGRAVGAAVPTAIAVAPSRLRGSRLGASLLRALVLACAAGSLAAATTADPPAIKAPVIWFHTMNNLDNDGTNAALFKLMERAAKAGYTGVMIHDGRFIMKRFQTPEYIAKVKAFRAKATELHLTVAAEIMGLGYGDELLFNDVNLAEGMPVRKAPFVVKDGRLVPKDDAPKLVNPGFEEWNGAAPRGWNADNPGEMTNRDEQVKASGASSIRMHDVAKLRGGVGRINQAITLQPWRSYHVSLMVKTDHCTNRDIRVMALGNGVPLNWAPLAGTQIKETMDWTRVDVTFDSLESTEATLYIGTWNGREGSMWIDDVSIEPAGFVNVIRRDDLPLTVTSADGATTYEEGKDFDRVVDPLIKPDIDAWHQPPTVKVPAGSRLKEGDVVLASYTFVPQEMTENNMAICMSNPKLKDELTDEARFTAANCKPDFYFLGHDEIRLGGWDDACAKRNLTPGEILADNLKLCCGIVESVDPGKPVVVWNDMLDPTHNAGATENGGPHHFFLVKGDKSWDGSWKGVPKGLGIVNWNNGNVDSVKFFAKEGHQQILSHDNPQALRKWLDETKDCRGVVGVMYTTWEDNWGPLEEYAKTAKEWFAQHGAAKP